MFGKKKEKQWNNNIKKFNKKYNEPYNSRKNNGKNNMILSENIRLGLDSWKTRRNQNIFCIGTAGTGTSRCFIEPNILQANSSFVINDPGGNLYKEYKDFLEKEGYKIKILNLLDMKDSNHYNPFDYIKDEKDVEKLVECIILNTGNGKKGGDPSWEETETALLKALIFYLIKYRPKEEQNFNSVLKLLSQAGFDKNDCNAESELDKIFKKIEKKEPNDISVKQYKIYEQRVFKGLGIVISTSVRLSMFNIPEITSLTQKDDMELEKIGDEKTALFVITHSTDDVYNYLISMLYEQIFTTLYAYVDKKCTLSSRLPCHVRFLLNDFENMGQIPEFEKRLATMRPYNISCSIITQHISQIKEIYNFEEIRGNCDTFIFFGSANKEVLSYTESLLFNSVGISLSELFNMNNEDCIIMIRGIEPFKDKKFQLENHEKYKKLEKRI